MGSVVRVPLALREMKAMDLPGTKVKLQVSEPWDAYRVLTGKLIRPITFSQGGDYYLLQSEEEGQWFVITARYVGHKIEDVLLGKRVDVGVAVVTDARILDTGHFDMTQVNYIWIGDISMEEPDNVEI